MFLFCKGSSYLLSLSYLLSCAKENEHRGRIAYSLTAYFRDVGLKARTLIFNFNNYFHTNDGALKKKLKSYRKMIHKDKKQFAVKSTPLEKELNYQVIFIVAS